tara:strand:- start:951 stop:1463 length:513 start_codon:yes stop_codon:yes gene_type:complete
VLRNDYNESRGETMTVYDQARVIELYESGTSEGRIAREMGKSDGAVEAVVQTGSSITTARQGGTEMGRDYKELRFIREDTASEAVKYVCQHGPDWIEVDRDGKEHRCYTLTSPDLREITAYNANKRYGHLFKGFRLVTCGSRFCLWPDGAKRANVRTYRTTTEVLFAHLA